MNDAAGFELYRPLMFSIAYRMLGSMTEAEDIIQDAYLRYQATAPDQIQSPKAFLSTIVTRLCLTRLESAQRQREQYIGPWLPEPVLTPDDPLDPARQAELHDSISMAFLMLLEDLSPLERAIFLLREVFDYDYAEIAQILNRDEAACRQLFSRARKHIAEHRPRFKPDPEAHRQMFSRFIEATSTGDLEGLMQLLTDDVTLWTDGGGKARGAALHPLHGKRPVGAFVLASTRFAEQPLRTEIRQVNGEPGLIIRTADQVQLVLFLDLNQDQISGIRVVGNPDKLHWIDGMSGSQEEENR